MNIFSESINEHIEAINALKNLNNEILLFSETCITTLKNKNKILIIGNGGSAADSQHFAAELVGRYKKERRGLPAIALTTDTSIITAIGNDYSYNDIFSRQIEALANKGDLVIAISTSGNSANIIKAVETAKENGCFTVGLLGKDGGRLKDNVDLPVIIPVENTARVQECHILIVHMICEIIEEEICNA
jgi:D-sedoheptulose 7-phosphate isomerase